MYHTPILIIAFNRPNHLRQLIESLKQINPVDLYIFCDGPRDWVQDDLQKCLEVKKIIIQNIDWDCNLKTNFSNKNQSDKQKKKRKNSENSATNRFFNSSLHLVSVKVRQVLRVQKNLIRINRLVVLFDTIFEIIF